MTPKSVNFSSDFPSDYSGDSDSHSDESDGLGVLNNGNFKPIKHFRNISLDTSEPGDMDHINANINYSDLFGDELINLSILDAQSSVPNSDHTHFYDYSEPNARPAFAAQNLRKVREESEHFCDPSLRGRSPVRRARSGTIYSLNQSLVFYRQKEHDCAINAQTQTNPTHTKTQWPKQCLGIIGLQTHTTDALYYTQTRVASVNAQPCNRYKCICDSPTDSRPNPPMPTIMSIASEMLGNTDEFEIDCDNNWDVGVIDYSTDDYNISSNVMEEGEVDESVITDTNEHRQMSRKVTLLPL